MWSYVIIEGYCFFGMELDRKYNSEKLISLEELQKELEKKDKRTQEEIKRDRLEYEKEEWQEIQKRPCKHKFVSDKCLSVGEEDINLIDEKKGGLICKSFGWANVVEEGEQNHIVQEAIALLTAPEEEIDEWEEKDREKVKAIKTLLADLAGRFWKPNT